MTLLSLQRLRRRKWNTPLAFELTCRRQLVPRNLGKSEQPQASIPQFTQSKAIWGVATLLYFNLARKVSVPHLSLAWTLDYTTIVLLGRKCISCSFIAALIRVPRHYIFLCFIFDSVGLFKVPLISTKKNSFPLRLHTSILTSEVDNSRSNWLTFALNKSTSLYGTN